jgi:ABC-type lipoprotein release transport system permease subunit
MRAVLEVSRTGLEAALLHPGRSAATIAALLALLVPYLAGLGLSSGIQEEARNSVLYGASLYVSQTILGREAPIPLAAQKEVQEIDGVREVTPRIVGEVKLGKDQVSAVLVGIPLHRFPSSLRCIKGRLYGDEIRNELVIGTELAKQLRLDVGSKIPPFYRNSQGERVSEVVGIFDSKVSIWQANLLVTSLETAAEIFDRHGMATELLVDCLPGYEPAIQTEILHGLPHLSAPRVTTRAQLLALADQGLLHREGVFNLHFLLAFAVAILVVLVTSGFGLAERRREIGILKAIGWQTDQVLLRCLAESLFLSVSGASLAIGLAYAWMKALNGYWVASVFLAGVGPAPSFPVPFRFMPVPALLAFILSFVIVLCGSIYTSWRAATAPPRLAMR